MLPLGILVYTLAIADTAVSSAFVGKFDAGLHLNRYDRTNSFEQQVSLIERPFKADGCQWIFIDVPVKGVKGEHSKLVSPFTTGPGEL